MSPLSDTSDLSCKDVLKHVLEYLDRELDVGRQHQVEQHLHKCRACYLCAEFEERLKGKLQTLGQEEVSEALEQRVCSCLNAT